MLKKKVLIPAAAIMVMCSNVNSFADENKVNDEYKEITYKIAKVKPKQGLNVRKTPEINKDNKVFAASQNEELEIVGKQGTWYKVELENNEFGWISSEYVEVKNESIYVNVDRLNFREDNNLDAKIHEVLNKGTKVDLIEHSGDWLKVKYENKEGYVYSKYIADEKPEIKVEKVETNEVKETQSTSSNKVNKPSTNNTTTSKPSSNTNTSASNTTNKPNNSSNNNIVSSNKQSAVVSLAKAQLGKPYVWGAEGPSSFDCSGLTSYVYKNAAGVSLPRTSTAQSNYGTTVSRSNLKAGDLIFFSTNGSGNVSHVGIYIGNGEMIHSPKPGSSVQKSSINNSYWSKAYLWSKRVL
ncbi:MAG: NlpC/P60 family protein [Peptostreptococcaceae bacterium]